MSFKYTDRYIENSFLYLLALSVLLHVALFAVIIYLPQEKKVSKEEPVMVDLQDLPPSKEVPPIEKKEVKRYAEEKRRVTKERAPKGEMRRERIASLPKRTFPPAAQPRLKGREAAPALPEQGKMPSGAMPPGEDLLRHRIEKSPGLAQLYPNSGNMARIEESYRKKSEPDVEEGETRFLNTDDIQFGSFMRRFENAVYGVWHYPQEAANRGIEGETAVRITFNRKGVIEDHEILRSSGSEILDNEVIKTLNLIGSGSVGPLPKGYKKDKFNVIAFFQYGIIRGLSRTLH
jgi:protein TonB